MSGCSILLDHGVKPSLEIEGGMKRCCPSKIWNLNFSHDQVEGRVVVYGISVAYGLVLHMTCHWVVVV